MLEPAARASISALGMVKLMGHQEASTNEGCDAPFTALSLEANTCSGDDDLLGGVHQDPQPHFGVLENNFWIQALGAELSFPDYV